MQIPNIYHMVLDEAYGSIGGDQHLVPYSKSQLQALTTDDNLYLRMKTFNHILSSQRITIERAFGMFVRKWGIFWKPLSASYGIEFRCQMLRVASTFEKSAFLGAFLELFLTLKKPLAYTVVCSI